MNEFMLAKTLGKFHYEIQAMPAAEFDYWLAFIKLEREEQEKAQKEAQKKSKSKKGR